MRPARNVDSFVTKLCMLGATRVFVCEGYVDRAIAARLMDQLGTTGKIDLRLPMEVEAEARGRTVLRPLMERIERSGSGRLRAAGREVELAIYADRDLTSFFEASISHDRCAMSQGYSIENDLIAAVTIESLVFKIFGIHGLSKVTGAEWCKEYYDASRDHLEVLCSCHWYGIPGKNYGSGSQYDGGWPPRFQSSDSKLKIAEDALKRRGVDPSAQLAQSRELFAALEKDFGFQRLINGKWYGHPLAAYCHDAMVKAGRNASLSHAESVVFQCAIECCDLNHVVFAGIRSSIISLAA